MKLYYNHDGIHGLVNTLGIETAIEMIMKNAHLVSMQEEEFYDEDVAKGKLVKIQDEIEVVYYSSESVLLALLKALKESPVYKQDMAELQKRILERCKEIKKTQTLDKNLLIRITTEETMKTRMYQIYKQSNANVEDIRAVREDGSICKLFGEQSEFINSTLYRRYVFGRELFDSSKKVEQ